MDIPVLKHATPGRVGMDRASIGMPFGYLAATHFRLQAHSFHKTLKNLIAVVWMHRRILVAVKNNSWDRWLVSWNQLVVGPTALSHGDERRGKINGGPTGETGVNTDCGIQIPV